MNRTLQAAIAVFAMAAVLASVAGGCLCAMPRAAAAHDCCQGDGGAILAATHDCCVPGTTSPRVLVAAASGALSPPVSALAPPWLDQPPTPLTLPPASPLTSAALSILRI
jgi:hypothetical protein